jgi:hypothetical protein
VSDATPSDASAALAADGDVGDTIEQVGQRWRAIDPLLPSPDAVPPGCGAEFLAAGLAGAAGRSAAPGPGRAAGTCEHWHGEPDSLDLTWGAEHRYTLHPRVAGDVPAALDDLLARWQEHLGGIPGADGPDTAAVVNWPSRDVRGVATLLRQGFAPLAVIAARVTDAAGSHGPADGLAPSVTIRRAGPADRDAVVQLGLEVVRFDSYFGGVAERPSTRAALTHETEGLLSAPQPWVWLAERHATPIGMLAAEPPDRAAWIAPLTGLSPVAYLLLAGVRSGERARGVGAALAAELNAQVSEAGVALTLLHYAQVNPLSAPFWSQQGYRPLWTVWERRPAAVAASP